LRCRRHAPRKCIRLGYWSAGVETKQALEVLMESANIIGKNRGSSEAKPGRMRYLDFPTLTNVIWRAPGKEQL
jgi:hypothetical protein